MSRFFPVTVCLIYKVSPGNDEVAKLTLGTAVVLDLLVRAAQGDGVGSNSSPWPDVQRPSDEEQAEGHQDEAGTVKARVWARANYEASARGQTDVCSGP